MYIHNSGDALTLTLDLLNCNWAAAPSGPKGERFENLFENLSNLHPCLELSLKEYQESPYWPQCQELLHLGDGAWHLIQVSVAWRRL